MKFSEMEQLTRNLIAHAQCVEVAARAASLEESYSIECQSRVFILYLATDLVNDYVRYELNRCDFENSNMPEFSAALYKNASITMEMLTTAAAKRSDADLLSAAMKVKNEK